MTSALINLRQRSLLRGNLLVLGSFAAAMPLSHFTHLQPRCIRPRCCFYHGGVLLCIYMDLMVLSLVFFLLVYPYLPPITQRAL